MATKAALPWRPTPNSRWHVALTSRQSACGARLGAVSLRDASEVPEDQRCARKGCRERWS